MRMIILSSFVLLAAASVGIIIMRDNHTDIDYNWNSFSNDRTVVEGVSLSTSDYSDLEPDTSQITFILENESNYEISYFYESITLQKNDHGNWLFWNRDKEGQLASAEVEHCLSPFTKDRFDVPITLLIPVQLKEPGEYRAYLPFSYCTNGVDEWKNAYVCVMITIK